LILPARLQSDDEGDRLLQTARVRGKRLARQFGDERNAPAVVGRSVRDRIGEVRWESVSPTLSVGASVIKVGKPGPFVQQVSRAPPVMGGCDRSAEMA
jgi:hypothetical protein